MFSNSVFKNTGFHQFRVVLVGMSGAGKSSFLNRYINKKFEAQIQSTTGIDYLTKSREMEDKTIKLEIWDTSGQERYYSTCNSHVKSAKVAIKGYDETNIKSL